MSYTIFHAGELGWQPRFPGDPRLVAELSDHRRLGDYQGVWGMGHQVELIVFPALFTLAVNNAPAAERSHAVGTFSLFFDLSQGLGAPVLGILVTIFDAERAAFVGGAVMAVGGLVLANTRLRASVSGPPPGSGPASTR